MPCNAVRALLLYSATDFAGHFVRALPRAAAPVFFLLVGATALLPGCGGSGDRQEDIVGLTALGAAVNPLVPTPSVAGQTAKTVELTFYAAVPLGQTASLAPYFDTGTSDGYYRAPISSIQVEGGTESYATHQTLQIYAQKVLITVPTQDQLTALSKTGGAFVGSQVTYGLTVTAGGATEHLIANFDVFPTGATELSWTAPSIQITAPTNSSSAATNTDLTLTAQVIDPVGGDSQLVGWYVNSGDVTNRRAANTTWKVKDAGPQTVIATLHGGSSRGFAFDVIDVQLQ